MGGIKEDWEILVFLSRWGTQAFTKGDILCEKQSKTQKNSFHVWFHTVPLLSSLPPDWAQPHWGPQTSSGHCCLTAVTMRLHLWDVAVLKAHDLKWRTLQEIKKTVQRGSCRQKACWKYTIFLGGSPMYMGNLYLPMAMAEYFQGSSLFIFWQHESVPPPPSCKCCSICHKASGSSLPALIPECCRSMVCGAAVITFHSGTSQTYPLCTWGRACGWAFVPGLWAPQLRDHGAHCSPHPISLSWFSTADFSFLFLFSFYNPLQEQEKRNTIP